MLSLYKGYKSNATHCRRPVLRIRERHVYQPGVPARSVNDQLDLTTYTASDKQFTNLVDAATSRCSGYVRWTKGRRDATNWQTIRRRFGPSVVSYGGVTTTLRTLAPYIRREQSGSFMVVQWITHHPEWIEDCVTTCYRLAKHQHAYKSLKKLSPWRLWELWSHTAAVRCDKIRSLATAAINKLFWKKLGFTPSSISRLRIPYSHSVSLGRIRVQAGVIIAHLKAPLRAKRIMQRGLAVVQTKHSTIGDVLHNFKRSGYELPEHDPGCN